MAIGIGVYEYIFIWRANITRLPDYHTRDLLLSKSMARPIKLRCVFNKVFLVSHVVGRKNLFHFNVQ